MAWCLVKHRSKFYFRTICEFACCHVNAYKHKIMSCFRFVDTFTISQATHFTYPTTMFYNLEACARCYISYNENCVDRACIFLYCYGNVKYLKILFQSHHFNVSCQCQLWSCSEGFYKNELTCIFTTPLSRIDFCPTLLLPGFFRKVPLALFKICVFLILEIHCGGREG